MLPVVTTEQISTAVDALIEKAKLVGAASVPCYGVCRCECIPCAALAALAATGKEVTG